MIVHVAKPDGKGLRAVIVASRYNEFITQPLVEGAAACLREAGVADDDIELFWAPGALEIPALAARVVRHGSRNKYFDVLICVGCVIRGETSHYDHVSREAITGVASLALQAGVGVGNAILTVENMAQAQERSGPGETNKGREAALAALEMANHYRQLR